MRIYQFAICKSALFVNQGIHVIHRVDLDERTYERDAKVKLLVEAKDRSKRLLFRGETKRGTDGALPMFR